MQRRQAGPPERPSDADCCGSGCVPCVFDVYERQLAAWEDDPEASEREPTGEGLSQTKYLPFGLVEVRCMTGNISVYTFEALGDERDKEADRGEKGAVNNVEGLNVTKEDGKDITKEYGYDVSTRVDDDFSTEENQCWRDGDAAARHQRQKERGNEVENKVVCKENITEVRNKGGEIKEYKTDSLAGTTAATEYSENYATAVKSTPSDIAKGEDAEGEQAQTAGKDRPKRRTDKSLSIGVGQHVVMRAPRTDATGNISRAYTPIFIDRRSGRFSLAVKLYPGGPMSGHLSRLRLGDVAHFRGPYGEYRHLAGRHRNALMLCAGTGVAPMYSVLRAIVADESDETRVRLLCAVRDMAEAPLRDEIGELAGYWNVEVEWWVSAGSAKGRYGERVVCGRLTESAVRGEMREDLAVLICGTDQFNEDMLRFVTAMGVGSVHMF